MLQAVRTGVFVAVDASCILRKIASVLQAASAIIWRESRQKRGDQGQQITRQRSDLSRGPTPCTAITAA